MAAPPRAHRRPSQRSEAQALRPPTVLAEQAASVLVGRAGVEQPSPSRPEVPAQRSPQASAVDACAC